MMAISRKFPLLAVVVVGLLTFGFAACGGTSDGDETARSAPSPSSFPSPDGRSIEEFYESMPETDLVVLPAATVFEVGKNRFPLGVFEVDRTQVDDADVALYAAKSPQSEVLGPFPARVDSLETKPAFRSQGASSPGEASTVYVVDGLKFDRPGPWMLVAVVDGEDGPEVTRLPSPTVGDSPNVIQAGQKAPRVSTPTAASVGGDLSKIDTRQPPSSMHDVDFKDVLGKKPVVLVFATPALCMSRVCGPVVDVAEQVKAEVGDGVAFIHNEIFQDNDPNEDLRPQLAPFGIVTEPWTFLIGKDGKVRQRIEGALGVAELKAAVAKLKLR